MRILRVLSGPAEGQVILVDAELTVGRHGATLTIDDPELSQVHLALRPAEGGVIVEDLQSTNGTYVDGRRIDQPVLLTASATIRAGLTELAVEIVPDPVTQISPSPLAAAAVAPGDAAGASSDSPPAPPGKRGGKRRGKVVLLALLALVLVAGAAELGYAFTHDDDATTKRAFVGRARTVVLDQSTPVVSVLGLMQARPVGQMTVLIKRHVLARPFPGGPPVGLILNCTFTQSGGAFKADVIGTVQITKTGGEIVRGAATVSAGTGTYEDVQGSFTIAGDNPHGDISRFKLIGTLEY